MRDLTTEILELVRLAATDMPPDVERVLRASAEKEEPGSAARSAMESILTNIEMAREKSTPICQDTGTPIFYVHYPEEWSSRRLKEQIKSAVAEATRKNYLRPNAVHALTGKNTGDNIGDAHFPTIHFEEVEGVSLTMDLMLKGGGCENVGAQYRLPDSKLNAGRDLDGVRKVTLDAVHQAQGRGCAPGILGIAFGGDRGSSYLASKEALLRQMDDTHPDPQIAELEELVVKESNQLGIGPMGFGGQATILGAKIKALHRLPASYFVAVTYMCHAYRRRRMIVNSKQVNYE